MTRDTVYTAPKSGSRDRRRYHTRTDCPYLESARRVIERDPETLIDAYQLCHWCDADGEPGCTNGGGSKAHYEALKAAAEGE